MSQSDTEYRFLVLPKFTSDFTPCYTSFRIGVKFWEFLKSRLVVVGRWSKVHLRNKRYLAFLLNLSGFLPAAGDFFLEFMRWETHEKHEF